MKKRGVVMLHRSGCLALVREVEAACLDKGLTFKAIRLDLRKKSDKFVWEQTIKISHL